MKNSEVTLSFNKCYFTYLSIQTLKHYIFKLNLSITKEKVKAIQQIKFSAILRDFEVRLNFFEYYRFFVDHFVNIIKSFIQFKT